MSRWASIGDSSPSTPQPLLALALAAPAMAQDASPTAADGQLARILDAGVIRMSTDPAYAPQSFLDTDGSLKGFDIDVGTEIAKRLGVDIVFETPDFALVSAGNWADRWDFSVGSVTITDAAPGGPRLHAALLLHPGPDGGARRHRLSTSLDDLAGKTVCMGEATTYLDWFNGDARLRHGDAGARSRPRAPWPRRCRPTATAPSRGQPAATTSRAGCRSSTTVQAAIAEGMPVVAVGDPVFYEPLAVAFDKNVEDNDSLVAAVDAIIGEMHADGTLSRAEPASGSATDLTTPPTP